MRAVTFQAPGRVAVEEVPEPELTGPEDAIVRIEASGVCGSDLHIYHGRVQIEPGFTIGHEYVGTVLAVGEAVREVAVGDRVLGCFQSACGRCWFCRARRLSQVRALAHLRPRRGARLAAGHAGRAGAGAERRPGAAQGAGGDERRRGAVRRRRDGHRLSRRASTAACSPGDVAAVLGLGPVGLCAVQAARAAGAAHVIAVDSVPERLAMAESFGAQAVHLEEGDPRAAARAATAGRGVDVCIDAVGHPSALDLALRLTRKCGTVQAIGVYAERAEVHMGLLWIKSLRVCCRPRQRDRAHRPRARADVRGRARPHAAGHPPHEPRRRPGGVRFV